MRILVTIPHFFREAASAAYGSERGDVQKRAAALSQTLFSLKQTFGHEQAHMNRIDTRCNQRISTLIDVAICTVSDHHLVSHLPSFLFRHFQFDCNPRLLGYECHKILADCIGQYDYYCFMEDDLEIKDALFFSKISWFVENAGEESVLQPHRFELSSDAPIHKLYIDSRLRDPSWSSKFQDPSDRTVLHGHVLGQPIKFERTNNPHSGCFFLNQTQMRNWMARPYFLDRSDAFAGPLESAATLGLMRTFRVYKPATENAAFLELQHLDRRYLGAQLRFAPNFRLKERHD